jgi:hypothetical protein
MCRLLQQPAETSAYTRHHGVTSHTSSFTICSYCIISYSMFPSSFVFICFPSLLSSHIHPFIVAEQWLGSNPSRTIPPPPRENFYFIFCVPSLLQEGFPDPRPPRYKTQISGSFIWHFYFALTDGFNFRTEARVTSDLYIVGVVFLRKT